MTKVGKRLINAAKDAVAIARGEADPITYRVHYRSGSLAPLHPGEVLREEFIEPLGLSAGKVAKAIGVPRTRIERVVREELGITGDTAVRLGRLFNTSPEFWMNLQTHYEIEKAKRDVGSEVAKIQPVEIPGAV